MIRIGPHVDAPSCSACGEPIAIGTLTIGRENGISFSIRLCRYCILELWEKLDPLVSMAGRE